MTDSNTTSTGHKLTERQKLQLAEVEAAGKNSSPTTKVDENLGGSSSNSDSAKASAPIPAGTPAGAPPRTGTTTAVPNVPPTPRT